MLVHTDCEVVLGGARFVYNCELSGAPVWGVIGSSGSGKTTFFNMIAGLVTPRRGRIVMNGATFFDDAQRIDVPAHRRRIGYVFQENRLFPHLSVRKNMLFGWRGDDAALPGEIAALLEIDHLLDTGVATLSGGEQKRVAIARAILSSPHMLLLDEPFAGLDRRRSEVILELITRIRAELDIPLLITSHDSGRLGALCDHFVLIEAGRVRNYGPCHLLKARERRQSLRIRG